MSDAIYFRCLQCRSERVNIPNQPPKDSDIVTCSNCNASVSYGEFHRANVERITKGMKERGEPDPSGLH